MTTTATSTSSADRAWVALRIVDVLRSAGIDAYFDAGKVHTGAELIDVDSLLPHLARTDRAAWPSAVQQYATGVAARLTERSTQPSSPLGRLVVEDVVRSQRNSSPSTSLAAALGVTPRKASPISSGRLDLSPAPNPTPARRPATPTAPQAPAAPPAHQPPLSIADAPTPRIIVNPAAGPGYDLAELERALETLSVRVVSSDMTKGIPAEALGPSAIPGTVTALTLGGNDWVTTSHLDRWRIDRDIAEAMAEGRIRDACRPDVDLVLVDSTSRVFVLESDLPEIGAALAYLELHVPLRPGETALIATGGEHVAIVSLGDTPTKAALAALVDSAVGEHAKRPGRLRPALYRWEPEGRISLVADDLDTAAGRLAVRALVRTAEPSEL
ncbi:MAG: hypothetical protein R2770_21840 [Acidimicrobiales bacterium]